MHRDRSRWSPRPRRRARRCRCTRRRRRSPRSRRPRGRCRGWRSPASCRARSAASARCCAGCRSGCRTGGRPGSGSRERRRRDDVDEQQHDQREHRPEQLVAQHAAAARDGVSGIGTSSASARASPAMISRTSHTVTSSLALLVDLAAVAHHDESVAESQDLLELGGDEHDGHAILREVGHEAWICALAPMSMPRVGSSRIRSSGSVMSQRASSTFCWLPPERLRISACGSAGRMSRASMYFVTSVVLVGLRDRPQPAAGGLQREHHVVGDREVADDALGPAVLAGERDLVVDRLPRAAQLAPLASGSQLAVVGGVGAEQQAGELGAARAEEAGDADDLALEDLEVDGLDAPLRPSSMTSMTGVAGLGGVLVGGLLLDLLERLELAADHRLDELQLGGVGDHPSPRRTGRCAGPSCGRRSRRPGRGSARRTRSRRPGRAAGA